MTTKASIEISYIEWGVPCKEVWSADIIRYTSSAINKYLEEKIANMLKLDKPITRYYVYINGENIGLLCDLVNIKK